LAKYLVVAPRDIVFNKLRTWQGGLGASEYKGIVSPAYFVCRPGHDFSPKFLQYLLLSAPYLQELTRVSKWQPPSQFDISWEQLRQVRIIAPTLKSQERIANYLDAETGRIDDLIIKKQLLLELLDQRIDAMVAESIGKSLLGQGTSARLSGTPMVAVKRVLEKVRRQPDASVETVTAYRDGQVTSRLIRRPDGYTESAEEYSNVQGVLTGDVVIHGLDGFAGAIGTSEVDGVCSPVYHVCTVRGEMDSDYFSRLLRVLAVSGYLQTFTSSTRERAYDFRNWDLFGAIHVPIAPLDEQRRIGDLVRSLRPLRALVSRSERIALERRQALITAAVTGQLDIPEVAA
jgi:type I restriction enzyme S subunit